jgi:hypothetical protein
MKVISIHNFISSSGSGTVINYGSGFDFFTSYRSGSTSQKVAVPVPQHCFSPFLDPGYRGQKGTGFRIRIRNTDVQYHTFY